MNAFSYYDMFSTKGVEYLLIIAFFLTFIPFLRVLREVEYPLFGFGRIRIPGGILFDLSHTWAYLKAEGEVQVGIDDFLPAMTGEVQLIPVKQTGEEVRRGQHLATLQRGSKALKIYAPVSGTLKGLNNSSIRRFGKRTRKNFNENWLFQIQPKRWDLEKALMFMGSQAQTWIQQESKRLKDVLAFAEQKFTPSPVPILLQEGGELQDGVLQKLPAEIWAEVQAEFIDAVKD